MLAPCVLFLDHFWPLTKNIILFDAALVFEPIDQLHVQTIALGPLQKLRFSQDFSVHITHRGITVRRA